MRKLFELSIFTDSNYINQFKVELVVYSLCF